MSTINKVLSRVDGLKVNPYSAEQKIAWISELDGKISLEVLKQETAVAYTTANVDTELLVPPPHDNLYDYYLYAQIDFHNGDIGQYNNDMMLFHDAFSDWKKYRIRTNGTNCDTVISNYC